MKKLFGLLLTLVAVFALFACGDKGKKEDSFEALKLEDYKSYVNADLAFDFSKLGSSDQFADGVYANATKAFNDGKAAINAASDIKGVQAAYSAAKKAIIDAIPNANGAYDFTGLSIDEKTKLTGIIEKYIVATGLTGITLYESGAYQMFNERVTLGTENYIPSYGFGTLAEGSINGPLATESNDAWKEYYHTYETSDPATANYWNDKGAQVGDIFGYFGGSLFETFMSDTKDSYKWVGSLSKDDRPLPVGTDGKTWRVRIRTGADGLKYTTNSKIASRAEYNNRPVEAEDYITPYKVLLTQHNGLYRGGESAKTTGCKIVGIAEYYDKTKDTTDLYDDALWNQYVGDNLKVYEENGEWYFQWTNTVATNAFYAMYYIASVLYSPIPEDFIDLVTLDYMWGYNEDKSETPVDNSLALGAYALEAWETDKAIVFKKNPNYVFASTKYSIKGIHEAVLSGISTDEDLAVKEFLAGKLDAAALTQNYLKQYKNDPKTRRAIAGSNFKINANTCDLATWESYFGPEGSVAQTAKADYWDLKPVMSNPHFYRALGYALDRVAIADAHGSVPSVSYLGSAYMADAENGVSYNSTTAHANAIKQLTDQTVEGYSLQLAREYFKVAMAELEAAGLYTPGTKEKPTVITIQIAWMYPNQEDTYHAEVKEMLEKAFNDESVHGGRYKLDVQFWAGEDWSDVYYKKLMLGQFDLGFGSISGNSYNILDYFEVLSGDQDISGGFTLNWGPNTGDPNFDLLVFKGVKWSFDALISAANSLTIVNDGKLAPAYTFEESSENVKMNADGSAEVEFTVTPSAGLQAEVLDVVGFGYAGGVQANENYDEASVIAEDGSNLVVTEAEDGKLTVKVTLSAADFEKWTQTNFVEANTLALDLYLNVSGLVDGEEADFSPAKNYAGSLYYGVPAAE